MNILTFDIEDWFIINDSTWIHHSGWKELPSRIEINVDTILKLLEKHNTKATFFILGWVAEHFPEVVRKIVKGGHEIGFHSYYHLRPFRQTPGEFEAELQKGLALLETFTGSKITMYRAPNLSVGEETKWIYPILAANGITISSSTRAFRPLSNKLITNEPFMVTTSRGTLLEFPLNRINAGPFKLAYSGSGFFRLIPLSILKKLFNGSKYNMLYFHPRDFDPQVPTHPKLSTWRNWKQSVNSSTTINKLDILLSKYLFHRLSEAHEVMSSQKVKDISV